MFSLVYQFGVDANTVPVLVNLVAWFDASDANSITSSGAPLTVSQWNDKSGNVNNATQGTASFQPELVAGAANGRPVLRFDGIDDVMALPSVVISGTVARTLFFVCRSDNASTSAGIISLTTSTTAGTRYDLVPEVALRVASGSKLWTQSVQSATDYFVLTVQNVASSDVDATLARLDGVDMVQQSAGARAINTGSAGTTRFGEQNNGSNHYSGDLAEIVLYDRALSLSEMQSVEHYLGAKWGVVVV